MKKRFLLVCSFVVVALMASQSVLAFDAFPPPWADPDFVVVDSTETINAWEFDTDPDPSVPYYSDYCPTTEAAPSAWLDLPPFEWVADGEEGGMITVFDEPLVFTVPNTDLDLKRLKKIQIQITSDHGINFPGSDIQIIPLPDMGLGSGIYDPTGSQVMDMGTVSPTGNPWYTYSFIFDLPYNPDSEQISITLPNGTLVTEVDIKTLCYEVPEPSSIALLIGLCFGGVLVWYRRRSR